MKNKKVRTASGLRGWRGRLRDQYLSFAEFETYSWTYGLAERLGFQTASEAWDANPLIEGSANPSDYRVVQEVQL